MKSRRIVLRFWVFTLLCSVTLMACAQESKKDVADKDKVVNGKSTVRGTVQTKNAAKTNVSQKQAGKGKA